MDLADFVYTTRHKRHISQKKLAELSGISPAEICRIEHGERQNPSMRILNKIAKAFDIPVEQIITTDKPTAETLINMAEQSRLLILKDLFN